MIVIYRHLQQFLIMLPSLLVAAGAAGNIYPAQAAPNQIFTPYLEQIKQDLSPELRLRLPTEIPNFTTIAGNKYQIKVFPALITPGITVSIFNCHLETQACLVASFSVNSGDSLGERQSLNEFQRKGIVTNLSDRIQGYLIEGDKQNPQSPFSAIMWKQDGLIYRVRFRGQNPQDIITVAKSMAEESPIDILSHQNIAKTNQTTTSVASQPITPAPKPPTQITNKIISGTAASPASPIATTPKLAPPTTTVNNSIPISAPVPEQITPKSASNVKIQDHTYIRLINITGNTVLKDEIKQIVRKDEEEYQSKSLTPEELEQNIKKIADDITKYYIEKGYITSKADLPVDFNTDVAKNNGVVEIKVTEGKLKIDINGTKRLKSYILHRILGERDVFNANKLEDQLRLLKQDPLFKEVTATLSPTGIPGETNLVVSVKEAPTLGVNVGVDNYSPPSIGSEKTDISLIYRNPTGLGDQIVTKYSTSFTRGSNIYDLAYQVPLNPMNGTLLFNAEFNLTTITESPFNQLDIKGQKETYGVLYRQPLIRSSQKELALSLGFTYDNGQTFTFDKPSPFGIGPDLNGVSRTSVISFGQDYTSRDRSGVWSLTSQFKFGTGLFNPTINTPPIPDGLFFSWSGKVQRQQRLSSNNLLNMQVDIQLTPDSLLPSQQFIIGGGDSVRGYRENVRSGDNGLRASVEDQITIYRYNNGDSQLILAPFIDSGVVWNAPKNPNVLESQTFLVGSGLGFIWQILPHLNLKLDYGYPLIQLSDRGNNIQDEGIYFRINYQH